MNCFTGFCLKDYNYEKSNEISKISNNKSYNKRKLILENNKNHIQNNSIKLNSIDLNNNIQNISLCSNKFSLHDNNNNKLFDSAYDNCNSDNTYFSFRNNNYSKSNKLPSFKNNYSMMFIPPPYNYNLSKEENNTLLKECYEIFVKNTTNFNSNALNTINKNSKCLNNVSNNMSKEIFSYNGSLNPNLDTNNNYYELNNKDNKDNIDKFKNNNSNNYQVISNSDNGKLSSNNNGGYTNNMSLKKGGPINVKINNQSQYESYKVLLSDEEQDNDFLSDKVKSNNSMNNKNLLKNNNTDKKSNITTSIISKITEFKNFNNKVSLKKNFKNYNCNNESFYYNSYSTIKDEQNLSNKQNKIQNKKKQKLILDYPSDSNSSNSNSYSKNTSSSNIIDIENLSPDLKKHQEKSKKLLNNEIKHQKKTKTRIKDQESNISFNRNIQIHNSNVNNNFYNDLKSCSICETIYYNSIITKTPIKSSFKCGYCNNFLNKNSLEFYEMKYSGYFVLNNNYNNLNLNQSANSLPNNYNQFYYNNLNQGFNDYYNFNSSLGFPYYQNDNVNNIYNRGTKNMSNLNQPLSSMFNNKTGMFYNYINKNADEIYNCNIYNKKDNSINNSNKIEENINLSNNSKRNRDDILNTSKKNKCNTLYNIPDKNFINLSMPNISVIEEQISSSSEDIKNIYNYDKLSEECKNDISLNKIDNQDCNLQFNTKIRSQNNKIINRDENKNNNYVNYINNLNKNDYLLIAENTNYKNNVNYIEENKMCKPSSTEKKHYRKSNNVKYKSSYNLSRMYNNKDNYILDNDIKNDKISNNSEIIDAPDNLNRISNNHFSLADQFKLKKQNLINKIENREFNMEDLNKKYKLKLNINKQLNEDNKLLISKNKFKNKCKDPPLHLINRLIKGEKVEVS